MENYNTTFSIGWLANIDTNPCINQNVILGYVAKYCLKAEISSLFFKIFLKEALKTINLKSPILLLATKMINKLIFEQDWLAQELYHHLLDWNLKACFCTFTNIDIRPIDNQTQLIARLAQDNTISKIIYLEKYCTCSLDLIYLTLLYIARYYDFKRNGSFKPQPKAKSKIIKIFLLYFLSSNHLWLEDFC